MNINFPAPTPGTQLEMRISSALLICLLTVAPLVAQERDGVDDTVRVIFPETAALRAKIAAIDSSRAWLVLAVSEGDSLLALVDSIRTLDRPWEAAPILRSWTGRFSQTTDSLLASWLAQATVLRDSAFALHMVDVQRSAVRVDSVAGVIDLAPVPAQHIYRVRGRDASVRFVQLINPHMAGDTIAAFVTPFGRKIFLSPAPKTGWDMVEGAPPSVSADSVFDLYREVTRPRAYDIYERFAARFLALQTRMQRSFAATLDTLRHRMWNDITTYALPIVALEKESRYAERALWKQNFSLAARDAERHGDLVRSVGDLLRLISVDSAYPGARETLARVRYSIDSSTRAAFFGIDGRANMELIPSGEVMLPSGERFRPEHFFIDRTPISVRLYTLFEAATGYAARGAWRNKIMTTDSTAEPVHGLTAEDKLAFAQWAGKRTASPQEIEYIAAGGFPTITLRQQHAAVENLYHVATDIDGFSCVRDLRSLAPAEQEAVAQQARARGKEIAERIEQLH